MACPRPSGAGLASGGWEQTSSVISGYGQDTWRVSDHLTLTLGLRYEAHTPWVESHNQQDNFDSRHRTSLRLPAKMAPAEPSTTVSYGGKAFQPRLGFAWTPGMFNGHTVVRGAFTVSDYLEGTGTNLRLPINPPFNGGASAGGEFQTQYLNAGPADHDRVGRHHRRRRPQARHAPISLASPDSIFRLWDQNVQPAIDDQWNLTIQHQFGSDTTLQVGYVGQTAYHLMVPFYLRPTGGTTGHLVRKASLHFTEPILCEWRRAALMRKLTQPVVAPFPARNPTAG